MPDPAPHLVEACPAVAADDAELSAPKITSTSSSPSAQDGTVHPGTLHVEDQRFAVVPEWVIDAELPDAAFRLYALLLRNGNGTGQRTPSRSARLHRFRGRRRPAMRQLVDAGMARVEHRRAGRQNLSNRYHVRTADPALSGSREPAAGRISAASNDASRRTLVESESRTSAATPGRTVAASVAAEPRQDREPPTDTPPPPASGATGDLHWRTPEEVAGPELLQACGIDSVEELSRRCVTLRNAIGQPTARWSPQCLVMAIRLAVQHRGWPATAVMPALLAIAPTPRPGHPVGSRRPAPGGTRRPPPWSTSRTSATSSSASTTSPAVAP